MDELICHQNIHVLLPVIILVDLLSYRLLSTRLAFQYRLDQ